jgi:hypothetical protein
VSKPGRPGRREWRPSGWSASATHRHSPPAAPSHRGEAEEAGAEQRDRGGLWNRGREFGDHDLAVATLEIRHQDLVYAGVKGPATTTRIGPVATSTTAKAAASAPTWISRAATASTKATVPADNAGEAAAAASSKIWEGAAAPSSAARGAKRTGAITTGGEEATTSATAAEATERAATSSAVTALPAVTSAAPASAPAALAGTTSTASADASGPTAAPTGDNQRRIVGADHEGATAPTTALPAATRAAPAAADGDLEGFPGSQVEVAADLGASTACAAKATVSTLRAKGEDLISVACRHRKGDEATGEIEDDWRSLGGRRRREPQKGCASQQNQLHFCPPSFTRNPPVWFACTTLFPWQSSALGLTLTH